MLKWGCTQDAISECSRYSSESAQRENCIRSARNFALTCKAIVVLLHLGWSINSSHVFNTTFTTVTVTMAVLAMRRANAPCCIIWGSWIRRCSYAHYEELCNRRGKRLQLEVLLCYSLRTRCWYTPLSVCTLQSPLKPCPPGACTPPHAVSGTQTRRRLR